MAWIKMTCHLRDKPEVVGISQSVGLDPDTVVGMLHHFWSWADANTEDGTAESITAEWIDEYVGHEGFALAMRKVSWISFTKNGLKIPGFEVHMSQSAKKRALTARRMKKKRDAASVTRASPDQTRVDKTGKTQVVCSSYGSSASTPTAQPGGSRPNLKNVKRHDLTDMSRLMSMRRQAPAGFPDGERGDLLWIACAQHALDVGRKSCGLFRSLVDFSKTGWGTITNGDEEKAQRLLKAWKETI